jgi:MFS family permease
MVIPSFYYGWVVTGCAFVVLFLTYGVQYSFGVFVPPMVDELGWHRASLGAAFSLYSVVYTTFTVLSGKLTDSLGPRRIVGVGGILLGVGLIATSQMSSQWQLFFWYGIVAALGMSTAYIPCNMTVVKWFRRKRGLALAIAASGASIGILVIPILSTLLIERFNWRVGLLVLGCSLFVLLSLAARLMVRTPGELSLQVDGDASFADPSSDSIDDLTARETVSWTLTEARATASFWVLLVGMALTMTTVGVPFVHIVSYARDIGLSDANGALAVSVIGLFSLLGGLSLGVLSDSYGRKSAFVIAYALQVVAFGVFLQADNGASIYLAAVFFGCFYGGFASLLPALIGDLFGPDHAGAIGGLIVAGGGILGGWGPALAGYLRDVNGDYHAAFYFCVGSAICAVILFALLPKPNRATTPAATL